ncbi:host specificity factor TipJ family phage tail protein [Ferrimonas pelagia]|uniref:Tip attachment protein J HDII-ins2 domain-containing protein n=1 Tax=Ferrimonas pelagia TaxID=1177826 RepID=A0ABP9EJ79_9GAMM
MTATVITYPNKLDKTQFEQERVAAGQTLTQLLAARVPSFRVMATPPILATLNGVPFSPSLWDVTVLQPGDRLELTVQPKGWEMLAYAIVAAVVAVGVSAAMAPSDNYNTTQPKGSPIYDVNAQGNQIRLMGVVPELFGTHGTFPSLICQPHRYFEGDAEYLLLMTLVSRGYLLLTQDDIQIGNTPISHYASDIDAEIFAPSADVSGHPAHRNVYTSPEIGATAGTSGIELEGAVAHITPPQVTFEGKRLTLYRDFDGDLEAWWPQEWELGQQLEISGTPGAAFISAGSANASTGWRRDWRNEENHLCYRSTDQSLHAYELGARLYYPIAGQVGQVLAKYTTDDGEATALYVVVIGDLDGNYIDDNRVDDDVRGGRIEFLGEDDGLYQVEAVTETDAEMARVDGTGTWDGFTHQGDHDSVTIDALDTLPGKPVGPFYTTPVNELTDTLHIDVRFPQGLGRLNDKGKILEHTVAIMLQWREDANSDWQDVPFERTEATRDQLGNTLTINLSSMCRPQVRAYRITEAADDTKIWDTIELVRLKSLLPTPLQYDDGTTLAVKIRGTNALAGTAENKLFCVPTRLLHVPFGDGWTGADYNDPTNMQPTNDIAPVLRYIAHEIGLSDINMGQEELLRLHNIWHGRGDFFDAQFDNADTFWAALERLLAVGYAKPTLELGQIIPVRDEPRTVFDHQYQPENMTGDGLKRNDRLFDMDEADGIEVEYFSRETWKSETVLCLLPGDVGAQPAKVKAFGVTDHQQAWRFGMRERRLARYIRTEYSWATEMDGFNSRYLNYVALADDVPGYAQTGQLLAWSPLPDGAWLRLDADLDWTEGETHWLALRKPDGRLSGPYQAVRLERPDEVEISGKLNFSPDLSGRQEPPLWMFGPGSRWCFPALVTKSKPSGTEKISMTARNYDARLYADDDCPGPLPGNDPVQGATVPAIGHGSEVTFVGLPGDVLDVAYFRPGDRVRLWLIGLTGGEYLITGIHQNLRQIHIIKPDGQAAGLVFTNRSMVITLLARGD